MNKQGKTKNQVPWNLYIFTEFVNKAGLNSREKFILATRILEVLTYEEQEKLINELLKSKIFDRFVSEKNNLYQGLTIKEQSEMLGVSVKTIDRIIAKLKDKYDQVQVSYPYIFPKRKIFDNINIIYSDFNGTFRTSDNKEVNFDNKVFHSFQEIRMYIINNLSREYGTNFNDLNKLHISLNIEFDMNINKE